MPLNFAIQILLNMYTWETRNAHKGKESLHFKKVKSQKVFWHHFPGSSKIKLQHPTPTPLIKILSIRAHDQSARSFHSCVFAKDVHQINERMTEILLDGNIQGQGC